MQRIFFLLLFLLISAGPVLAQGSLAGSVKNVKGEVLALRQQETIHLEKGMKIYSKDVIRTGPDGSAGLILQDNTIFSLGPDTELAIKEFVFIPDQGSFALIARMIKGTFVYISGVIGKLSPESIRLETPVGTIAVRGTRFAAKITGSGD